ncbi:hypothetical protein [Nostoc sp.]|uniref:hypothetical protein n=1 Tax=Nostoc sp. TaxID=1180 RepID=UPI002FF66127
MNSQALGYDLMISSIEGLSPPLLRESQPLPYGTLRERGSQKSKVKSQKLELYK